MIHLHVWAAGLSILVVGLLCLPGSASAQRTRKALDDNDDDNKKAVKAGVHKLEIYNGELRTVHYYTDGLSESERADVRDLARAQNNVAFASYNKALAEQPIGPGFVRPVGYGYPYPGYLGFGFGGFGFGGYFGYPAYFGDVVPAAFSNLNYLLSDSAPLYQNFMPYYGFGFGTYGAPVSYANTRPIVGAAYLDRCKSDVPLTRELNEEVSQATRHLDVALGRVMRNDTLAKAFDLRPGKKSDACFASDEPDQPYAVTVTMKKGPAIKGTLVREDRSTITLKKGGSEIEIRKSETVMIEKRPLNEE
jgi:hypothetical protein